MSEQSSSSVRVADLRSGDVVEQGGDLACFIAEQQHPLWPHLRLVTWRLDGGGWSVDALDARQVVGERVHDQPWPSSDRLLAALTTGRWTEHLS